MHVRRIARCLHSTRHPAHASVVWVQGSGAGSVVWVQVSGAG